MAFESTSFKVNAVVQQRVPQLFSNKLWFKLALITNNIRSPPRTDLDIDNAIFREQDQTRRYKQNHIWTYIEDNCRP